MLRDTAFFWRSNNTASKGRGGGGGKNRSATKFRKNAPQVCNFLYSFVQDCSLEETFLFFSAFCSGASCPCLDFQHHDCIACWIFDSFRSRPLFSYLPLRPTTEISHLLWFSVDANSKICRGRSRNSSVVESQSYFVSERPFFRLSQTKYISLLASLRRWALSYRHA